MPASSSDILAAHLRKIGCAVWPSVWHDFVRDSLALWVYQRVDFTTGIMHVSVGDLDDIVTRSSLIPVDGPAIAACSELLLSHRTSLNAALRVAGRHEQSVPQLRKTLREFGVTESLMAAPNSAAQIVSFDTTTIWTQVATLIARAVYIQECANPEPEWLLLNRLLLSRFLQTCRLSSARQVVDLLGKFSRTLHGPRGSLIALVERVDEQGIVDDVVPAVPPYVVVSLNTAHLSDLLSTVDSEAKQIPLGHGLMHRYIDIRKGIEIPAPYRHVVSPDQLVRYRDSGYRQYEATLLTYTVISAIEQLLRSWASHVRVPHLKLAGYPHPVSEWIDDPKLAMSTELRAKLKELYDPAGANLRNRAVHSGLLEVESTHREVILSVPNPSFKVSSRAKIAQSLLPGNILSTCIASLQLLDKEASDAGVAAVDLRWADQLWLTAEELEFGNHIHCDVLDEHAGLDLEAYLAAFVNANFPVFSIHRRMAWIGWLKPHSTTDSVLSFMAWGVIFEGVYRMVAHLHGVPVLQRGLYGAKARAIQYRTLDAREGGLCAEPVVAAIVGHLESQEQPNARRTVQLAVKVRNALAHGAMLRHDDLDHLAAGHLFIKALQLLVGSALDRMTEVAAYYRWRKMSRGDAENGIQHWLNAEKDVMCTMWETARKQTQLV